MKILKDFFCVILSLQKTLKPRCWEPPGRYLCTPEPGRPGCVISMQKGMISLKAMSTVKRLVRQKSGFNVRIANWMALPHTGEKTMFPALYISHRRGLRRETHISAQYIKAYVRRKVRKTAYILYYTLEITFQYQYVKTCRRKRWKKIIKSVKKNFLKINFISKTS